jgi:hypothetical protein
MKQPLLLLSIWVLCQPTLAQEPQVTIPGLGISLQRNAPVPEGFAERIREILLPSSEWSAEGLSFGGGLVRAYKVTYAKGGGIITIDRDGTNGHCRFNLKIERSTSARIRHQIMVGTDKAEWEIIRRNPPSPSGEPFARTYLLRRPSTGQLLGLVFYEGTWAELACGGLPCPPGSPRLGPAPEAMEKSLLRLTWNLAQRLPQAYWPHIAPIAKSLDDGSPETTRPDLPDADARPDQPMRKQ